MEFLQKRLMFLGVLILFLILLFYNTDAIGRVMYPIQYQQEIQISGENYQIDPLLIASFIRTESNYKPNLTSTSQAVGLMQIMPETADWIISSNGFTTQMKLHLNKPDVNIELGTWYLRWLMDRYHREIEFTQNEHDRIAVIAAAYNAGQTKVSEWIHTGVWDGTYENRSQIPYGETRHYVKRIHYYYAKYQAFYTTIELDKAKKR